MSTRYRTTSDADTRAFGGALGALLLPGDALLLRGDLGAGKSVMARGAAGALGVHEPMPSPTFTLMQPYMGRLPVYHFDLYRLSDLDEFEAAGLDEYIDADGACLIEWPLAGLAPRSRIELELLRGSAEDERVIELDARHFPRSFELTQALKRWEEDLK